MKKFNEKHIKDLQEADGFVLQNASADDYAKKLEEKQWHLGDIVEDGKGHKAMIVLDDNLVYELMNVNVEDKNAFKVFSYFAVSGTLSGLQDDNPEWHKVVEG